VSSPIYRVTLQSTSSLQPSGTFWSNKVLYCGTDRAAARVAYHSIEPLLTGGSYGNRCERLRWQVIEDGGAHPDDDPVDHVEPSEEDA